MTGIMRPYSKRTFVALTLITASSLLGLAFSLAPIVGHDSKYLLRLVGNMIDIKCLSYNPDCTPTTTDLGPGYPYFIYTLSLLARENSHLFAATQAVALLCTALTLAFHLRKHYQAGTIHCSIAYAAAILNPLIIGWTRFIHPDALAYCITILLMILLDRFRHYRRTFELLAYAALVSLGSLFRYEFILFSAPIFIIFFGTWAMAVSDRTPKRPLVPLFMCLCLCLSGLSLWSARNVQTGLPPLREGYFFLDSEKNLTLEAWIKTWTINQWDYERGLTQYFAGSYRDISPPNWATSPEIQEKLKSSSSTISKDLESLIADKTEELNSSKLLIFYLGLKRAAWLILNPFWSAGLADLHPKSTSFGFTAYIIAKLYSLLGRVATFSLAYLAIRRSNNASSRLDLALLLSVVSILGSYLVALVLLVQLETRYLTAPTLALLIFSVFVILKPNAHLCRDRKHQN